MAKTKHDPAALATMFETMYFMARHPGPYIPATETAGLTDKQIRKLEINVAKLAREYAMKLDEELQRHGYACSPIPEVDEVIHGNL